MHTSSTMDKHIQTASIILSGSGLPLLDAARLIRNASDSFQKELTPLQFCAKVISSGLRRIRNAKLSIS